MSLDHHTYSGCDHCTETSCPVSLHSHGCSPSMKDAPFSGWKLALLSFIYFVLPAIGGIAGSACISGSPDKKAIAGILALLATLLLTNAGIRIFKLEKTTKS